MTNPKTQKKAMTKTITRPFRKHLERATQRPFWTFYLAIENNNHSEPSIKSNMTEYSKL